MTPEQQAAYDAAVAEIVRVKESGETVLNLTGLSLPTIPHELSDLTGLQTLVLSGSQITDLTQIGVVEGLRSLHLSKTRVGDLEPIKALTDLQSLHLTRTQVADLAPLSALTELQKLNLSETQVTELGPLSALANLRYLDLGYSRVADVAPLSALYRLLHLDVRNTSVTDLAPISSLKKLQSLVLDSTPVSELRVLLGSTDLWRDAGRLGFVAGEAVYRNISFNHTAATRADPRLKNYPRSTTAEFAPRRPAPIWKPSHPIPNPCLGTSQSPARPLCIAAHRSGRCLRGRP